jgi:CyaY protein
MTESEFLDRVETVLQQIENAIDAAEADIEITRAGNVLTLELADGSRIVVNSQAPMQQLWLAARSGAHHYAWSDGRWRDTRDGSEFFATLSRIVSSQGGVPLLISGWVTDQDTPC